MPVAIKKFTVGPIPLTTVEGGEVTLRKFTWGEALKREELVTRLSGGPDTFAANASTRLNFDFGIEVGRQYDFRVCIVSHNLTDDQDRPLDLSNLTDFSQLDVTVGQEIADLIDKVNQGEDPTPLPAPLRTSSSAAGQENGT